MLGCNAMSLTIDTASHPRTIETPSIPLWHTQHVAEYPYVSRVSTKSVVSVWSRPSAILNFARSSYISISSIAKSYLLNTKDHYHFLVYSFSLLSHRHCIIRMSPEPSVENVGAQTIFQAVTSRTVMAQGYLQA